MVLELESSTKWFQMDCLEQMLIRNSCAHQVHTVVHGVVHTKIMLLCMCTPNACNMNDTMRQRNIF